MAGIIGAKGITCKNRVENYILCFKIGEVFLFCDMMTNLRKYCSRVECSALLARDERVQCIGEGVWERVK